MAGWLQALMPREERFFDLLEIHARRGDAEEIVRIEEEADQLYDAGRKALFMAHREDSLRTYLVGADIFGRLEKVVDHFEDVANQIGGILIENG